MIFMLGNLTPEQFMARTGSPFTEDELRELRAARSGRASLTGPEDFHIFVAPNGNPTVTVGSRNARALSIFIAANGRKQFPFEVHFSLDQKWSAPQPEGEEPMTTAHDMSRFQRLIQVESGRVRGQFKVLRVRPDEAWVTPVDLTIYDEHHYSGIVYYSGDFAAHVKGDTVDVTRLRASKHADAMDAIEDLRAAIRAAAAAFPEGVQ